MSCSRCASPLAALMSISCSNEQGNGEELLEVTRLQGGTGLGLYLSRELVEQHGGHLWFESEEDAGSSFFLTLPIICICAGKSELPATM